MWRRAEVVCLLHLLSLLPAAVSPNQLALLAGTLRTFQRHACDSTSLALSCPAKTTIDIIFARYGRPQHAHLAEEGGGDGGVEGDPCPPLPHHSPLNHKTVCQYQKGVDYETLQLVVSLCQHRQQCSIAVEPSTFGRTDPCPLTRKYIEVAYKCRPETFINKVVCVAGELTLTCSKDSRIAIYSVLFGRSLAGSYTCPQPEGVAEEECKASYANEIVMDMCHGRRECHILASPEVFGNPCSPSSNMYMKTVYTCVPKKILKPPKSEEEEEEKEEEGEKTKEKDEEAESTRGGYEEGSLRSPPAPPPADPQHTSSTAFYNPTITTRLADKSSDDSEASVDEKDVEGAPGSRSSQYPQDESTRAQTELINCTVTILAGAEEREIGYLTEWMQAVAFVKNNFEKFLLYLLLGVSVGLVLFLVVVVTQLLWDRRRARKEAKMMQDPLTSVFAADIDDIDGDLDLDGGLGGGSLSGRSPSPPQDPTREVVRYNTCRGISGGGLRRQDSDTNPRSLSRNNNNQLFYS